MTKAIGALGLLLIGVLGACDFMSHARCEDRILSQEKSPDGKYIAILYQRSCANQTGLYTCVSLQETARSGLSTGEIQPVLTIRGFHEIDGVWIGPNHLEIKSEGLENEKAVVSQESSWKTVGISYKR